MRDYIILTIAASVLASCATGQRLRGERKPSRQPVTATPETTAAQAPECEPPPPEGSEADNRAAKVQNLALRLSRQDVTLTDEEQGLIDSLSGQTEAGSLEEATVALAVIYKSSRDLKFEGYEETDLFTQQKTDAQAGAGDADAQDPDPSSLEVAASEYRVDLIQALRDNPLLRSVDINRRVYAALNAAKSSTTYDAEVRDVLRKRASRWAVLHARLSPEEGPASDQMSGGGDTAEPTTGPRGGPLRFSPGDFGNDEEILQEAKAMAIRGQYKEAIQRLTSLNEESPSYAAAQEQARELSNQAVRKLRTKAAKAFQSAIPVSDPETKAFYLKEARKHLEEALEDYPEADQLATVRENLTVINRDLSRIQEIIDSKQ